MKVNFHLDKKNKPQSESGMKVVYGQAKRGGYRLRWYLILAIVVSPLLFMAYYLFRTQVLVTAPAIITSYPLTVTATRSADCWPYSGQCWYGSSSGPSALAVKRQCSEQGD